MNKYAQPIVKELDKKFKFLTQLDKNLWLIQSKENSNCEAFFVATSNEHIIMMGDYDGIMVRPYGAKHCLPNWMAGATTLSYFAEKVCSANRYHKTKQWDSELARKEIEEHFIEYYNDDREGKLVKYHRQYSSPEDKEEWITDKAKDFLDRLSFDFSRDFGYKEMYDSLNEFDYSGDWAEYEFGYDYHSQIKWQHKCLIFWACKVLDGSFKQKKPEVDSSQPLDVKQEGGNGIPPTNKLVGILPKIL